MLVVRLLDFGLKAYLDILKLVWPLALGMMNNAVLQFTDRAFLARESMASLEAALPASMLAYTVLGFFQSVVAYSGTFVAQYHGAGNGRMIRMSYRVGLLIAIASGLIMLAALPLGALVFEEFSNGPEIIAKQKVYYNICTIGGVFLFGQMAAQSFFTGIGRTRIVLLANILGNILNVLLDPILIFGWFGLPRLGIAGAAYATVFCTAVQWGLLAFAARRAIRTIDGASRAEKVEITFCGLARRVLRYGIPSGAYSVLNSLSFTIFVFFTGMVGHVEAAVSNAGFSVCYLLFAPMEGFALGCQALVGQARGRKDDDLAMKTGTRCVLLGCLFAAFASILIVVFRHPLLSIYEPSDSSLANSFHAIGSDLFVLMALWQVFDASDVIISGALKGVGDTRFVMWWMLFSAFVIWIPMVYVVSILHNTMQSLWGTMIFYVLVICAGSLIRWYHGGWKRINLV